MEKTNQELVKKSEMELIEMKNKLREPFILKPYIAAFSVWICTVLFTITGVWQLIIIAGFIGGFFCKRAKLGALIGAIGVFIGWMSLFIYYVLTTEVLIFFQFWIEDTMGYPLELVYLLMFVSSLFGGFFGGLGGINGVYIREILLTKIVRMYF